jgi:hypothetical protein
VGTRGRILGAVKEGHILSEAWWSLQGKRGLFTPEGVKFNASATFLT